MDQENEKAANMILRVAENGSKILDTFTKGGVAYLGYKSNNHWTGALAGLIALRLATGGNLAAGVAGTGVLAAMGLSQINVTENVDLLEMIGGISNPLAAIDVIRQMQTP